MMMGRGEPHPIIDSAGLPRLTAVRLVGTAVILGVALLLTGRVATLVVPRRQRPTVIASGAGGVALVQPAYFVAIDRLPIGLALLQEYTAPLIVALVTAGVVLALLSRSTRAALPGLT